MNTNDTVELRHRVTQRLADFLTQRLGGGDTHTFNVGDCFLQTSVMDLADEDEDGQDADDEKVEGDGEGLRLLGTSSGDPIDPADASGHPAEDQSDEYAHECETHEYEPYNAFLGRQASHRALLIDMNGLGCWAVPAEGWTPQADPWLEAPTQERMRQAGMRQPEDGLPLWWTRMDSSLESEQVAAILVAAFVDALDIPVHVVAADLDAVAPRGRSVQPRPASKHALAAFTPSTTAEGIVEDPEALMWDYSAHLMLRREAQSADWPRPAGGAAAFFALVDNLDLDTVKDLVALAPASPGSSRAAWFRRCRSGWIADPTLPRRMARTGPGEPLRSISRDQALAVERRLRF